MLLVRPYFSRALHFPVVLWVGRQRFAVFFTHTFVAFHHKSMYAT